jgi:hypothetical protein
MRFDRRGCLLTLGAGLLVAVVALAAALLLGFALGSALLDVMPAELLIALVVLVTFLLWGVFSFVGASVLAAVLARREAALRQRFERRTALADNEFTRLMPESEAAVAAAVRAELGRFVGHTEVTGRLLPADPVRATCRLAGFDPDDLDWAEFLLALEARFGVLIPDEADREATIGQLIGWCAGCPESNNRSQASS